jgi:hypothetical protein
MFSKVETKPSSCSCVVFVIFFLLPWHSKFLGLYGVQIPKEWYNANINKTTNIMKHKKTSMALATQSLMYNTWIKKMFTKFELNYNTTQNKITLLVIQNMSHLQTVRNPSSKWKATTQNHVQRNLHMNIKNLYNRKHCFKEFQIIESYLKPHNLELYSKH